MLQEEIEKYNREFKNASPEEIMVWVKAQGKKTIVTTNFRPYESAILFVATHVMPNIPVIWCDSGYNLPQTYRFGESLIKNLKLNIFPYVPKRTVAHRNVLLGIPEVGSDAHDIFTNEVKLEPFSRAMEEHKPEIWLTNLRKGQTELRNKMDVINLGKDGVIKVCPFYHYSDAELDEYLAERNLPNEFKYYDPTKALENRECGLHQ